MPCAARAHPTSPDTLRSNQRMVLHHPKGTDSLRTVLHRRNSTALHRRNSTALHRLNLGTDNRHHNLATALLQGNQPTALLQDNPRIVLHLQGNQPTALLQDNQRMVLHLQGNQPTALLQDNQRMVLHLQDNLNLAMAPRHKQGVQARYCILFVFCLFLVRVLCASDARCGFLAIN
jgi:hypothetical protein